MRSMLAIAKREFVAFWYQPLAYVLLFTWLLWNGVTFYLLVISMQASMGVGSANPLSVYFGGSMLFYVPLLVIVPLLTMNLIAKEDADGSLAMMRSCGVSPYAISTGKFIAAWAYWLVMWAPILLYAYFYQQLANIDWLAVCSSFLGVSLIGAMYVALGLFASSLTKHPMVAALLAFGLLGFFFLIGLGSFVPALAAFEERLRFLSVWQQMSDFGKGIVVMRAVLLDLGTAVFGVFLAAKMIEGRAAV